MIEVSLPYRKFESIFLDLLFELLLNTMYQRLSRAERLSYSLLQGLFVKSKRHTISEVVMHVHEFAIRPWRGRTNTHKKMYADMVGKNKEKIYL